MPRVRESASRACSHISFEIRRWSEFSSLTSLSRFLFCSYAPQHTRPVRSVSSSSSRSRGCGTRCKARVCEPHQDWEETDQLLRVWVFHIMSRLNVLRDHPRGMHHAAYCSNWGSSMQRTRAADILLVSGSLVGCVADVDGQAAIDDIAATGASLDPNTYFSAGAPKGSDPFFASLGTNGRACATCHVAAEGWSITPADMQARFNATGGTDPVFRTNDGSVSPTADVSTVAARRNAYAMLLSRGDIRVGIGIPSAADFTL